jgi:hypothetical protein
MGSINDTGNRLLLRACPRCTGTLCKEQDTKTFETVWYCLNCGAVRYGDSPDRPLILGPSGRRKKTA